VALPAQLELIDPTTTTNQRCEYPVSQPCFTPARPAMRPLFISVFSPISSHKQIFPFISSYLISQTPLPTKIPSQSSEVANMKFTLTTPALLLSSAASTHAWGTLGHETVAFIAQNFVAADTKVFFSSILNDYGTEYLAKVATWADSFRYTQAGQFSAPFHFIDAEDNPPDSCGVKYSRDCGKSGCIVGAINNYVSFWVEGS
jgi:S1/P1 Nuclease